MSIEQEQEARKTNSYLNETDDFDRYESYLKSQGIAPEAPIPTAPEATDEEKNLRALREKYEKYEKENQILKANLDYMKSVQQPVEPKQQYRNPLDDLDQEEALPTGIYRTREMEMMARLDLQEKTILGLQNAMKYPDYADVVDNYAAPLINENPNFRAGFQAAPDPYKFAYDLGVMAKGNKQAVSPVQTAQPVQSQPPTHPNAQRILDNSRKPGSLANTGGQGSFHNIVNFATMSDQEFDAKVREIQAGL